MSTPAATTLTADSPSTIIVARHGLRIDFVDPNWRRTAARPHDSPMTQSGRVMGWRMGVHLWARLRELYPIAPRTTKDEVTSHAAEVAQAHVRALLQRVVVLASPLIRAVDTAAHVCQGLEDAAFAELTRSSVPSSPSTSDFRKYLPLNLPHPDGHPMFLFGDSATAVSDGSANRAAAAGLPRIPINVEPAMTETTYWLCRDMCKKYGRSYLESAEEVPHPIVMPADYLRREVSNRVIVEGEVAGTCEAPPSAPTTTTAQRAPLCPVHYQFDPRRGAVVEALQPVERFSRAWVHLLAPQHYATQAPQTASWTPTVFSPNQPRPNPMVSTGHTASRPFAPIPQQQPTVSQGTSLTLDAVGSSTKSPYADKIVLLLGHGQTVEGMVQTLPHVLHSHFGVDAAHAPRVTPREAPLAGFAMFHRRSVIVAGGDVDGAASLTLLTYDTIVDAFSEEHLGVA